MREAAGRTPKGARARVRASGLARTLNLPAASVSLKKSASLAAPIVPLAVKVKTPFLTRPATAVAASRLLPWSSTTPVAMAAVPDKAYCPIEP